MKILRQLRADGGASLALAAGNFDGCHLGHRALLAQTRRLADANNLRCAVLTFEPHPLTVLRPGAQVRRLGGARDKITQLAACGAEVLYLARFTKATASTSARDFAAMLFTELNAKQVIVGENFRFGKDRAGDIDLLRRTAEQHNAQTQTATLLRQGGEAISSGRIRSAIEDGDFDKAKKLLGREWSISGRVVRGKGFGARLGFPTANLHLGFTPPCRGIFAAWAEVGGEKKMAAVSIGANPTTRADGAITTEAHLPAFKGDLYATRLTLTLRRKLRDEQHYPDTATLKTAITADIRKVREILISLPPGKGQG